MRNGKSGVLNKISINGKTWDMMPGMTRLLVYVKKQKSRNGYESEVTVYECTDCSVCLHKEKCTKGNKRLYVSKNFIEHRQISYENIMSETGIKYRMNRSIQVESAFGVLKIDYDLKIQNDRLGSYLFPLKVT